jgi:hypothetical protein
MQMFLLHENGVVSQKLFRDLYRPLFRLMQKLDRQFGAKKFTHNWKLKPYTM